eukprot:CAMPEP_0179038984 /NCGR_PEP_ID=MMETSP0796-20121207/14914_1 /TAXON_ID=73915 /ORGANISM="Pyrodinium bahamense, Strain pbaha01" /LENGTH=141 /DNA_ID=CAMNT_0020735317 /DNA_START=95 /DNA_END=520 /DNA_ORIENTATION=-
MHRMCTAMLLFLAAGQAGAASLRTHSPGPQDEVQCCTTCHRFGMKILGDWNPIFTDITSPVTCCDSCKQVFGASLAAAPVAAAQVAQSAVPAMTVTKCKTICHRFGMKSLGGEFAALTSPVECAAKCDEKYASGATAQPFP